MTNKLDIDYFKSLKSNFMSPYATEDEQYDFTSRLHTEITNEDAIELRNTFIAHRIESYEFKRFSHFFYQWNKERQVYQLFTKEGNNVGRNEYNRSYSNVRNSYSYNRPITNIGYIKYIDFSKTSSRSLPEDYKWSMVKQKTIDYVQNYLKPSILARYAMFNRPTNGLSNVIVDSFIPKLMYQFNFETDRMKNESNLPSTAVTISPWFAQLFGIKQMTTEQMCRILGYTKKDIKNLLVAVRRKEHKVAFIGYGGTNVNTVHWLTEMCTITHTLNLFKHVSVYERDTLEISNLLRFPKNPEAIYSDVFERRYLSNKMSLITTHELRTLSKTKPTLVRKFISSQDVSYNENISDHILYGAPDIESRELFAKNDLRFIAATHTGNSAFIHINPTQDSDITVETYGLIQLSVFFMNQLKLAITLLETLANNEINLYDKDVEVLNYTFSQDKSLSTDRKYNFQLDHDGHMVTEEIADAVV